ncbi:MAG: NAD-dependent deacetylase, partial [Dehalococcoidia bacterium]
MAASELEARVARAIELVVEARYPMALVGAGISVESGIPPFRGPGGLWTKYGEPEMDGYRRLLEDPRKWWLDRLKQEGPGAEFHETFQQAKPNAGHVALAEMETMGYMKYIITQNVDNLHQEAGSQRVAEIHGNMTKLRCIGCNTRWHQDEFRIEDYPPLCPHCGGIVKDDTVMFGEPIPVDVLQVCQGESSKCDCM